ncbi:MAG: TetR/AcrR family transcriptional regulator [Ruminococcaceae bacterium]|nr:TetR/AcrR family transcriptional regulator [Oscillospiraceae bacterium]
MPKIIENLPQRLLEEAKNQILQTGYSAMTIRSVAHQCGVGVGTVYNYYRSKEEMVAAFLLEDWKKCTANIISCAEATSKAEEVLQEMHRNLVSFSRQYAPIFEDHTAAQSFSGSHSTYHGLLRKQLADPLGKFCKDAFTAEFIAEAVLTWTMAGKSFDELYCVLKPLFEKEK